MWMVEGLDRREWERMSKLLSMVNNIVATERDQIKSWAHFNPYYNGEYGYENLTETGFWDTFDPDNPTMRDGGVDAEIVNNLFRE